jgi:hypothetical protein
MSSSRSNAYLGGFQTLCGELGRLNASLYALHKLLLVALRGRVQFHKYYFVAQPVSGSSILPAGRGKKIQIRLVDERDVVTDEFPRPRAVIEERYRQGAKCLAAFKDDRFIGYLWLISGTYQEDEIRASFSPVPAAQAVWDFDVYVAPEFRIGLTFPRMWDEANRFLADNQARWSCSRISAFNAGSLSAHARLGTKILGSACFLCFGRWQATFATVAPYFHLSTDPKSFPAFRLDCEKPGKQSRSVHATSNAE